jgi:hypothetical protein
MNFIDKLLNSVLDLKTKGIWSPLLNNLNKIDNSLKFFVDNKIEEYDFEDKELR